MEIIFQSHHATVSPRLRERAERAVSRAAQRLRRAVDAVIRFESDGPTRRVEIVLHAPRQKPVVAEGRADRFGAALASAVERLNAQTRRSRRLARTNPFKLRAEGA